MDVSTVVDRTSRGIKDMSLPTLFRANELQPLVSSSSGSEDFPATTQQKSGEAFPVKLHKLITAAEECGMEYMISWRPNGQSFRINNKAEFEKRALPFWFNHSQLASFQRQLLLYGFRRISNGVHKNSYYHELFQRGKPELCERIQRAKKQKSDKRKIKAETPKKKQQQHFYHMQPFISGTTYSSEDDLDAFE